MVDLTTQFYELISTQTGNKTIKNLDWKSLRKQQLRHRDEFIAESYKIKEHIKTLFSQLLSIRKPYLNVSRSRIASAAPSEATMTDQERDEIDLYTKTIIQRCLDRVTQLEQIEQERQAAENTKKLWNPLNLLLSGSTGESAIDVIAVHRGAITWTLSKMLMQVSETQKKLQEARLKRELERQETFSWKHSDTALNQTSPNLSISTTTNSPSLSSSQILQHAWNLSSKTKQFLVGDDVELSPSQSSNIQHTDLNSLDEHPPEEELDLSDDERQLLEMENDELLKSYQSSLEEVKKAEQTILEISQMQSSLSTHIAIQARETEQLYSDVNESVDNVKSANVYLTSATKHGSDARRLLFCFLLIASAVLLFLDWYG